MSPIVSSDMHRTTVRLDEHLLAQTKDYATRHRRTLTGVIEDALRALLAPRKSAAGKAKKYKLPVSKAKGGYQPGIKSWADIKRIIHAEDIENFKRVTRDDVARR